MKSENNKIEYSNCIVTYLDILGFKNIIETKSPEEIKTFLDIFLYSSLKESGNNILSDVKLSFFSDLIVRTRDLANVGENPLYIQSIIVDEIKCLKRIQKTLITEECLVPRGGMTIGEIYQDRDNIFGPALNKAYDLESKKALFPRIILDDKAVQVFIKLKCIEHKDLKAKTPFDRKYIKSDLISCDEKNSEDFFYINYLAPDMDKDVDIEFLIHHKDLIQKNLRQYRYNAKTLSKYIWLKTYHNEAIEFLSKDHKIVKNNRKKLRITK